MEIDSSQDIKNLNFQWKTKRWFLIVFLFNIFIPLLIIIDRFIAINVELHSSLIIPQLIVFPLLLICIFCQYVYLSKKFFKDYSEVIKQNRFRYFYWGIVLSFISFCLYIISLSCSAVTTVDYSSKWPPITIYVSLIISIILGTASTALITLYEFCISFDIFYSKNKINIVKEYLRRTGNTLKIEEREEINED